MSVAALPRRRYRSAFEPGCSIGVLTGLLAGRCERVLAVDGAEAAVAVAREHLTGHHNVTLRCAGVPGFWPPETFDLIVVSEIGYYFDPAGLAELLARVVAGLEPGGDLLAVHWRHPVADYPLTGDAVHAALQAEPGLARTVRHLEADFVLEVFARVPPDPISVAQS